MCGTVNRSLVRVRTIVSSKYTYIHSIIHKCFKITKGCRIGHKYMKYVEFFTVQNTINILYTPLWIIFTHKKFIYREGPQYPSNRRLGESPSRSGRFKQDKTPFKFISQQVKCVFLYFVVCF
jgi:hypothetical protein